MVWVADDNTGDYALLSTALAAITDATSSNPYVIKIAPGIYTETAPVVLKDYVDVEGSGQDITTINCACSSNSFDSVMSAGAITAEIRHLTINNTGGGDNSFGVYTKGVTNGSFSMDNVTATATGGTYNYGVFNDDSSSPSMNNVTATATGGTNAGGVYNTQSSSPSMNNVTATASGTGNNFGVINNNSSPSMNNVTATATGGGVNYGVQNDSSSPTIRNSSFTGSTNSIRNSGTSSAQVADTMLDGQVDAGGGLACVGVYTTAFVALNGGCL